MKLTQEQLKRLVEQYDATKKIDKKYSAELELAIKTAIDFVEEQFDEYMNLIAVSTGDEEYKKERESFYAILDNALSFEKDSYKCKFNPAAAFEESEKIRRKMNPADLRALHGQSSNLGIREKYLNGTLGTQEWLADVDLKRMITSMDLQDDIYITRFNPVDIGMQLHFAREKNGASGAPYSIPLLLNKGSAGRQTGSHWFSVVITVDPTSGDISYVVDDSIPLSESQKREIERVLEQAIHFKETSVVQDQQKVYEAFPGRPIVKKEFADNATQKDSFSCGYRALHALLNSLGLAEKVKDNIKAEPYANLPRESTALVQHVYKEQLDGLEVAPDLLGGLARKWDFNELEQDGKHKLKASKVTAYVDHIGSGLPTPKVEMPKVEIQGHETVSKILKDYERVARLMSFPILVSKEKPLLATDYEQFFLGLLEKTKDLAPLEFLVLTPCDPTALDGLIALATSKLPIHFKHLTLDIAEDLSKEQQEGFVIKLKTLLPNLSEKQLKNLKIDDKAGLITEAQWKEIAAVVQGRGITVDVILPKAFQITSIQRDIDRAVSTNQFNQQEVAKTEVDLGDVKQTKKKRTRPRPKTSDDLLANLSVDIELQQEQQVEVAVQAQKLEIQDTGKGDFGVLEVIKGNDWDGLFDRVRGAADLQELLDNVDRSYYNYSHYNDLLVKQFRVPKSSRLLTQEQLNAFWANWFGHVADGQFPITNRYLSGMTTQACEQLFLHAKKFPSGFDQNHLPKGFAIIDYPKGSGNRVLHYDSLTAKEMKTRDLLAPVLQEEPQAKPLAAPVFEKIMGLLRDTPNGQVIAAQWDQLNSCTYDRETVNVFKQNLGQLATYSDVDLTKLFELCTDSNGTFNTEKFDFIMNQSAKIAELFSGRIHPTKINPAFAALKELFGEDGAYSVISLARAHEASKQKAQPFLDSILSADHPKLSTQLKEWQAQIPTLNSEALLQVYSQRGPKGLQELFALLEKTDLEVLKALDSVLFSRAPTYMPLLDPKIQESIRALSGLNEAQKQWWNALLKIHGEHVGYDDLPVLLGSFKQFCDIVKDKRLEFYKLHPHSFVDVYNLPVALARMVTILDNCNKDDLNVQWECITRISLNPAGAILAITDGIIADPVEQKKCSFIVPEMELRSSVYEVNAGYKSNSEYWHDIGKASAKELKKLFFLKLAYEAHHLPLSFYYQAIDVLEQKNFAPEVQSQLYALLFASTTGEKNSLFLEDIEQSLTQWSNIVDSLGNLPLPGAIKALPNLEDNARKQLVERLFDLTFPPSLPVLVNLLDLIANSLLLETSNPFKIKAEFEAKMDKLDDTCRKLEWATKYYGDAIYHGMQFYGEEEYSRPPKESIFYSHMAVTLALIGYNSEAQTLADITDQRKILISLISTFQIDVESAEQLANQAETLKMHLGEDNANYVLTLLTKIDTNTAEDVKLSPERLLSVLKGAVMAYLTAEPMPRAKKDFELFIQNYVEKELGAYYAPDYFKKLQAKGIAPATKTLIEEKFPKREDQEQVIAILNQFEQPGESNTYDSLVKKIAKLSESMTPSERKNFLDNLQRTELYQTNDGKLGIATFEKLLDAMLVRGHVNDFMYLLAQPASIDATVLAAKAIMYLETTLPALEKTPSQTVSKKDALGLITRMLLSSSPESLTSKVEVERSDERTLEGLISRLTQLEKDIAEAKPIDLKTLEAELLEAKGNLTGDFKDLNDLLDQLKDLNKPRPVITPKPKTPIVQEPVVSVHVKEATGFFATMKTVWNALFGKKQEPKQGSLDSSESRESLKRAASKESVSTVAEVEVIPEEPKPTLGKAPVGSALKALRKEQENRALYQSVFTDLFKEVYRIAENYPGAKKLLIDFVKIYIDGYDRAQGNLIVDAWKCVDTIRKELSNIDTDVIRSLCYHFSGTEGEFTPETLLGLMRAPDYVKLHDADKRLLLTIASVLLNNDKHFTLEEFNALISRCSDPVYGKDFLAGLRKFYATAPYPDLEKLDAWHEKAKAARKEEYANLLKAHYAVFDKHPCEREIGEPGSKKTGNGFRLKFAENKVKEFTNAEALTPELASLDMAVKDARKLYTEELIQEFKKFQADDFRKTPAGSNARLVAIAAELLYRSKGNDGPMGSSFEINTTQYLAILGAMNAGKHNTSEIGTGEGKSRIMAILNACQYGQGKTVDFVTSDVSLATRDYLEFQSYFSLLGAETNIIYADTPASEYRRGGINYSDASNLSLFRNKARSMGQENLVIVNDKSKRALMLDEADKTYFDSSDVRYNFSTQCDESLKGMEWVYPLLVEFLAQDDIEKSTTRMDLYFDDVEACNEAFLAFVVLHAETDEQKAKLKRVSEGQLETWLESAVVARALIFDKKYAIESDVEIETPYGPKIASDAKLISGTEKSANSKFSFGVHQCLHAHLNMLRAHPDRARVHESPVSERLKECLTDFTIEAEKQIIYSSSSKSLLDDYGDDGTLIAVTGTAGSIIEREEATHLYGKMEFIVVPRHNGLNRVDKAVRLTADEEAQLNALVDYILEFKRTGKPGNTAGKPVLVICEDDSKSKAMNKALVEDLQKHGINTDNCVQLISNDLSAEERNKRIERAGKVGLDSKTGETLESMITISTGMIGRGTDIKLSKEAVENGGLEVMGTYLPRERDMLQFFGRAGRAGQVGGARLVLNKKELERTLGNTALSDGFYTQTETFLKRQQALMDRNVQCMRLIVNVKNDFDKLLTDNFFDQFKLKIDEKQWPLVDDEWRKFIKNKDQEWKKIESLIKSEMDKVNPDVAQINGQLALYQKSVQGLWSDFRRKIEAIPDLRAVSVVEVKPISLLKEDVGALKLGDQIEGLLQDFDVEQVVKHEVTVYDRYDPSHDGRAVVYSRPFEKLRAVFRGERNLFADFFAAQKGEGIAFPNLTAWWKGHISFGHLFGFAATKEKVEAPVLEEEHMEVEASDFEAQVEKEISSYGIMAQKKLVTAESHEDYLREKEVVKQKDGVVSSFSLVEDHVEHIAHEHPVDEDAQHKQQQQTF
ncbi:MAG: hypothetical protein ACRCXC_02030 [Legionella sp.]